MCRKFCIHITISFRFALHRVKTGRYKVPTLQPALIVKLTAVSV
jgi:hypothetical protein